MPNARILFPENTSLDNIFAFLSDLERFTQHDRLVIELPEKAFVSPFMMLMVGSKIRYIRNVCPNLQIIFNGWERYSYLSHMGFFAMCGYEHGKGIGQASGSERYLPITRLDKESLYETKMDKYEEMQDLLQRSVDRVSSVLAHDPSKKTPMFEVLSYSVREIFRNVFEHGDIDHLYYCAQFWPKSNKVEFAVIDHGIGVRRGLSRNPNFRFETDKQALEWSLFPSVSGRTHEPRRSENWFNSGYGLYMTHRLARHGGNFLIASGNSAISFTAKTKNNHQLYFKGTALRVNLKIDEIGDIQKRLAQFRDEGKEIASKIKGSGNRPPSAMSLLLRRDYKGSGR